MQGTIMVGPKQIPGKINADIYITYVLKSATRIYALDI
jgi:hypothetical protein